MKREDIIIAMLGIIGVLVIVSLISNSDGSSIKNVTGSVIGEPSGSKELIDEVLTLKEENKKLADEKNNLQSKIDVLENKLKQIELEKEAEEETCPVVCDDNEICSPINKKDGSVEWQCVDDPSKFV